MARVSVTAKISQQEAGDLMIRTVASLVQRFVQYELIHQYGQFVFVRLIPGLRGLEIVAVS